MNSARYLRFKEFALRLLVLITLGTTIQFASAAKFDVGDRVEATGRLSVRQEPGTAVIDTKSAGDAGQILEEPKLAYLDGTLYVWWKVNWDTGSTGWSVENFMREVVVNRRPVTPTNLEPNEGSAVATLTPRLRASAYSDPDGHAHWKTWWEVKRASDSVTVWDSTWRTTDLTSTTVPQGKLTSGVQYKWRVRYMDSEGDWSDSPSTATTFIVTLGNRPPATPSNVAPAEGSTVGTLTPSLRGSTYSDPDGDAHWKTWWEVKRVSDDVTVWDSGWRTTDLTSTAVPQGTLISGGQYKWRVRYMDSRGELSENASIYTAFRTGSTGEPGSRPDPSSAPGIRFSSPIKVVTPTFYYFDRNSLQGQVLAWNGIRTDESPGGAYDGHRGTDFSGLARNTPVYAAAAGRLVEKRDGLSDGSRDQTTNLNGNFVRINHGNDDFGVPIISVYLHLNAGSITTKPINSWIEAGELIGGVGMSGQASGLHLHFELQRGEPPNRIAFDPYPAPGESSWWWQIDERRHPADLNEDQILTFQEIFDFLLAWILDRSIGTFDDAFQGLMVFLGGDGRYEHDSAQGWISARSSAQQVHALGQVQQLSSGSAVRDLPTTYSPGEELGVSLTITPPPGTAFYAIEEQLPPDWTASAPPGGNFNSSTRKVQILGIGAEQKVISYRARASQTASGTATFSGRVVFGNQASSSSVETTGDAQTTMVIIDRLQEITFSPLSDVPYGHGPIALVASASSGFPVRFEVWSGSASVNGSALRVDGAGTITVRAIQDGGSGWLPTQREQSFSVAKARLTARAEDKTKRQGESNPSLTLVYNGFVNGDGVGVIDSVPLAQTSATQGSPIGDYPITLSGGTDDNYEFQLVSGILRILPPHQDSDLPLVSILHPSAGSIVTSGILRVSGSASDPGESSSGVVVVEIQLNGGDWVAADGTSGWSATINLAVGKNTVGVRSRDANGNLSSVVFITVTRLDATPIPTLTAVGVTNGLLEMLVREHPGNIITLEVSRDLHSWAPLLTSSIPTSGSLTVNQAFLPGSARQFFRGTIQDAAKPINRPGTASSYLLSPNPTTWIEAQAYAQSVGGNLVTLEDQAEQDWLSQTFTNRFWIGLYRDANSANELSSWKWVSGSSSTFRNWNPGHIGTAEPNNSNGDEYYSALDGDYWSDSPSGVGLPGYQRHGIVEIVAP